MTFVPSLVSVGAFLSAGVTGTLAALGATRRKVQAALPFSALALCLTFYSFGTGFEYLSPTLRSALFWTHIQYLGISFIPLALALFGMFFSPIALRHRRLLTAFFLALSLLTLIVEETAGSHRLFYLSAAMAFTLFLVVRRALRTAGVRQKQGMIVTAGLLVAILGYLLYISGLMPGRLDLNPLFLALSGLLFAYGLFRYHILSFTPIAHIRVFEAMHEGGIILDNEGCLVDFNDAARGIFPKLSNQWLGEPIEAVLPEESTLIGLARSEAQRSLELFVTLEGTTRCFDVTLSHVDSRRGRTLGKVIILNDTTRQFELARELKELAIRDPLTQLFTRRHFLELAAGEMERAKRSGRAVAAIMIDLDHFKAVNDTYGHPAGDRVLIEVAERIRRAIRTYDVLCRYGGEEFLLFLPETDLEAALVVAERMRRTIASGSIAIAGGAEVLPTASFGVSVLSGEAQESIDDLIHSADRALYRAKLAGRNRVALAGEDPEEGREGPPSR